MKYKVLSAMAIMLLIVGLTYASDNANTDPQRDSYYEFMDTLVILDDLSSRQFINTFSWFEEQEVSFSIKYIVAGAENTRMKYFFSSNQVADVYRRLVENYINDLREKDLDLSAEVAANGFRIRQVMVYTSRENIEEFVRVKLHQF